ncbi:MAG TPA: AraC family transcriptional regulator [Gammaproteobacteria bacterium]|nr:AraC family transcriptional regulator [Gammaproteobacteria bacterium]
MTTQAESTAGEAETADTLSDVLQTVKLTGALYFITDAAPPWGVAVPDGAALAPIILPRAQHVMSYHIVTQGNCWAGLMGKPTVALEQGDIVIFPHGDPYVMSMDPGGRAELDVEASMAVFGMMAEGRLPFTVREGGDGADRMHLVCGFLGWDVRPFNPLLATLPRLLRVRRPATSESNILSQLIELTIAESREKRAGADCMRLRLSELMFIEVVRRHFRDIPAGQSGWLAGLRDPFVGRALVLLHKQPAHSWILEELAESVGLSRSALAERFAQLVGQPPMQYLSRWRMQVAARLLADGAMKVSAVARTVGYASEAAFSRSFKKATGVSPAAWRQTGGRS